MTRLFAITTATLTAIIGVLLGMLLTLPRALPEAPRQVVERRDAEPQPAAEPPAPQPSAPTSIDFADVAARINPAVVNIDATARSRRARRLVDEGARRPDDPFDLGRRGDAPRRGTGTGFLIDAAGHILTNHHVIEGAERLTVKLADGRSLRAEIVGSDPDTDIALIKVDGGQSFPHVTLGDSSKLRAGDWVCAIGNPLAYEHTVTVGVVSFIGRKLFDPSLDNYIQTDAAISFGNSGGPLINARGQVIGINSAISRQATNIGFAVPINQARAVLPQLKSLGRVERGFIGVTLRDVDPDLQASLKLSRADGALVQDVAPGSPGARAGLRPYDVIVSLDGDPVRTQDRLTRSIAERRPGTPARLEYLRNGRAHSVTVRLAERPRQPLERASPAERSLSRTGPGELGLSLIEIDETNAHRFDVPAGMTGLLVQRVEPMSPAFDADIERGHILLEINRQRIQGIDDYRRLTDGARPGDILTMYLYKPELNQRALETVKIDER